MPNSFPKVYEVQGDTIVVDEELHHSLNVLAGRFYACHNYRPIDGFDYSTSSHPQEVRMYQMALEAVYMQRESGAFD